MSVSTISVATPSRVAIKKILFATDFSLLSKAALPYALSLAQKFSASIHLAHIVVPAQWQVPTDTYLASPDRDTAAEVQARFATLVKTVTRVGIACDFTVKMGADIWHEISNLIRFQEIDLVVLGTHGREGLRQLLLGSVAETVFRMAPCPALTVGPRCREHAPATFRRILLATDLTEQSLKSVPFVFDFADNSDAEVLIAHVATGEKPRSDAERALAVESVSRWMQEMIPPRPRAFYTVLFGTPAEAILWTAADAACDLIVLGAHAASGISTHLPGAIAHQVVAEAHCPVLIVHPPQRN